MFADPQLLLVPGDVPGRLHAPVRRRREGLLGGGRHPRPDRQAPVLGRERGLRLERGAVLHQQHRERLAGPRLPHRVRSRPVPAGRAQPEPEASATRSAASVHLAGGLEWRDEKFTIGVGQTESWDNGPFADQGFSAASNGFPGFSPISEGNWSRSNFAGYVDLEAGRGSNWNLGVAARLEHFADFGTTLNGKLAGRYEFNPNVAAARQRQHRLPRAHARTVERLQRLHAVRPRADGPGEQRHHPVDLGGGRAARRRAAGGGEVPELLRGARPARGQGVADRPTSSASTCATAWP